MHRYASQLAVVLQAEQAAPRKYKIHRFLDDRDEWLDSMYDIPTDGKALTGLSPAPTPPSSSISPSLQFSRQRLTQINPLAAEEISKFALVESVSTVR